MFNKRLAIIIPAYKAEYLEATLRSLLEQTNAQFKVYVGDDCSPYDLEIIVEKFTDQLDIVYHHFEDNLGSTSLTRQWERCIELADEDWIWLFSDDDLVAKDAVQVFYDTFNEKCKLYKFHTEVIDENGQPIIYYKKFDNRNSISDAITSSDFIHNRLACNGFRSFAVEYVFHRSLYEKFKFVDFPLAWGSDDATWFLYSLNNSKEITVLSAKVYWRFSGINISSDVKTLAVVQRKLDAASQYIKWVRGVSREYQIIVSEELLLRWLSVQVGSLSPQIGYQDFKKLIRNSGIFLNNFKIGLTYLGVIKKGLVMKILKGK